MDILKLIPTISWCKPDWNKSSLDKELSELLRQCSDKPKLELSDDIQLIINKSKAFPIPFPVETVRLEQLKSQRPVERLKENIVSTYPIVHEKVLLLMARFLTYKREFGTSIEKALYKDMTVVDLIDRILKKRAITFMGPRDTYKLMSGEEGKDGWESVGTLQQKPPLTLDKCLSYDEMKLSVLVYISGHTECINDGTRRNCAKLEDKNIEQNAVIIGVIGARFKRKFRMEYEDIVVTKKQNVLENGYGEATSTNRQKILKTDGDSKKRAKQTWRRMWSEFYQAPSYTYDELKTHVNITDKPEDRRYIEHYVKLPKSEDVFDNEVYYKRLAILCESVLLEAEQRAAQARKHVFINVIGAGLGVWMISKHQIDVYIIAFVERIQALLKNDVLKHVSDVNFAYIQPSSSVLALFPDSTDSKRKIFLEHINHSKGGINVQLENREPSSELVGEHADKLLVMTYPWDGNAHPGNEFWIGKLFSSGDPAAACSTQISELHNAHINTAVSGANIRVIGSQGVKSLDEYCEKLNN